MNYERIYNAIIERAKTRQLEGYIERHHIIPKCMNGTDDASNLAELTAKEHFICHLLLVQIYPGDKKLVYALWRMVNSKGRYDKRYIPSGRIYEFIKQTHANVMSETYTGRRMSKECIEKRKLTRKSFVHTEMTKEKISKANSGKIRSDEFKQNLSKLHKGKQAWNKGISMNDDVKQRISETMKRVRALKKLNNIK